MCAIFKFTKTNFDNAGGHNKSVHAIPFVPSKYRARFPANRCIALPNSHYSTVFIRVKSGRETRKTAISHGSLSFDSRNFRKRVYTIGVFGPTTWHACSCMAYLRDLIVIYLHADGRCPGYGFKSFQTIASETGFISGNALWR